MQISGGTRDKLPYEVHTALQLCQRAHEPLPEMEQFRSSLGAEGFIYSIKQTTYLVFRGTDEWRDRLIDVTAVKTFYKNPFSPIRVHAGFKNGYHSIRKQVLKLMSRMESERLVIIGHSYGGALATFAALDFPWADVAYLFATPKVGNNSFVKMFNRRFPRCFNIIKCDDIIPCLPLGMMGYSHVGTMYSLDRGVVMKDPLFEWPSFISLTSPISTMKERIGAHLISSYIKAIDQHFEIQQK
jgi:predicted lipase